MDKAKSFLNIKRKKTEYRPIEKRIKDYKDVVLQREKDVSISQGDRCMDCGTPFCHWGCALGNYIPEWKQYNCH
jgi:glutamate synthase (NADPH/NADH) small chain